MGQHFMMRRNFGRKPIDTLEGTNLAYPGDSGVIGGRITMTASGVFRPGGSKTELAKYLAIASRL
jgi:hypothetical protein